MNNSFSAKNNSEQYSEYKSQITSHIKARFCDKTPLCYVRSFGCQQSMAEGEIIAGILNDLGYALTSDEKSADIIFYNTCAVRQHAEDKVFGILGELKHLKACNPNLIIGVSGCMTQQEHNVAKIKKSYPFVDIVIGTNKLDKLPQYICNIIKTQKRVFEFEDIGKNITENLPVIRENSFKASVPIAYGCNNFCTYCIVPYVRGREGSRTSKAILCEVQKLVDDGYKEITLLGQNVNSYGKDLDEDINFSKLLCKINEIEGDFQIRFMTSHPKDASYELIDAIAECDKVCNHLHLPVQSGSNRILSSMNRHYNIEHYKDIIAYAKQKIPNLTLTSDIIVGFPSETYEDFKETYNLCKEIDYAVLYTFIFSKRKGTKAYDLEDNIPYSEKSKWFTELTQMQNEKTIAYNESLVKTTQKVLFDQKGKEDGIIIGRTEGNIIVEVKGTDDLIGKFSKVLITKARKSCVLGEII